MVATADASGSYEARPQSTTCKMLHTEGSKIVDSSGNQVILKGTAIGGMLNMENFITGYAGQLLLR